MAATDGFAPAKINLTLHVTGQRPDGYHLLDSLVAFADIGDTVSASVAPGLSLSVTGPMAEGVPTDDSNLVLRAARLLAPGRGAALVLDKRLPAASGIGGGSSDAAAALRVLAPLWGVALPPAADLLPLGADVPVCLDPRPVRMQGIGERLSAAPALPHCEIVLVNPRQPVPTPQVFRALTRGDNPAMPGTLPRWRDLAALAEWLRAQRNDLEPAAIAVQPAIAEVLEAMRGTAPLIARMSGSGATCFALYASGAAQAAQALRAARPDWWVASGRLLPAIS